MVSSRKHEDENAGLYNAMKK